MRAFLARVAHTIRHECLIGEGSGRDNRVAIAVSGGADSVALTWILHALAPGTGLTIAGLIHLNHQLRGSASDADEAFCRALAVRLDLPVAVTTVDVAALARERRVSLEVAARDARYAFFETAATGLGASVVATGHTMDDQAETVLLRLLRGAGTRGLSGIRVRRDRYVRPLIHARRADLVAYLQTRGEGWREDASNADRAILRNRVRHELLPLVEAMAPGGVVALARLAALANDDETFLTQAAIEYRPALVLSDGETPGRIQVDSAALSLMPAVLARRLIRALAAEAVPGVTLAARHLEAVCRLAATDKSVGHLDLPGLAVEKHGDTLTLAGTASAGAGRLHEPVWPERPLAIPGEVVLPEAGLRIEVRMGASSEWNRLGAASAALQARGRVACRCRSGTGGRATGFDHWARPGVGSYRTCSWTGKCREWNEIACRWSSMRTAGSCGWPGSRWPTTAASRRLRMAC